MLYYAIIEFDVSEDTPDDSMEIIELHVWDKDAWLFENLNHLLNAASRTVWAPRHDDYRPSRLTIHCLMVDSQMDDIGDLTIRRLGQVSRRHRTHLSDFWFFINLESWDKWGEPLRRYVAKIPDPT